MSYNDGKFYGFTNDEIFGSIMQNKRFCKAIIKAVLPDVNVVSVESIDTQKELGTKSDKRSKSVRLDIAVKDQAGNLYDLEMQVNNNHDITTHAVLSILDGSGYFRSRRAVHIIGTNIFDIPLCF